MTQPEPPQTLAQAVERLLASLSTEEQQRLCSLSEKDLSNVHFSLGMEIRNSFPIWGNKPLLESCAMERRQGMLAEMEKALASAKGDKQAENTIRDLFGRILQQESIHPDDASGIIIYATWEHLRAKLADQPAPHDSIAATPRPWWRFWK